jgi:nickel/cobalt exporter
VPVVLLRRKIRRSHLAAADHFSSRDFAISAVLVIVCVAVLAGPSLAQTNPFGGPHTAAAAPPSAEGLIGWILVKQSELYRQFAGLIRSAKADGSAVWSLLGVSFLYGIFHAAGPGHGKAVISSYLVANEETWRRGVALSFASALLQALVAVAVVGLASLLFQATRTAMCHADYYLEIASYGLIALIGARLTWSKGRSLWRTLMPKKMAHAHEHHDHGHDHHGRHEHHGHDHAHHHDHDDHAGHAHGPEPAELAGPGGWRRGLAAIVAVGLRPCSGAIIVLVFALTQGLFWAGAASAFVMGLGTAITVAAIATVAVSARGLAIHIAKRRDGRGALLMRAIEAGAAVLVLVFGIALLFGYMATERLTMACA